jgi:DeoR family transcriptional regulator, suf operon transcriptional repressor
LLDRAAVVVGQAGSEATAGMSQDQEPVAQLPWQPSRLPSQAPARRGRGATRNAILDALKRADGLTADQLARRLGITPMAVRKHLAALAADGLATASSTRRAVGRPAQVYRLSARSDDLFPKQYDSIVLEFLSDLARLDGPEKVDLLFNRRAERTFEYLERRVSPAATFDERVAALAEGMDELGYLVNWECTGPGCYVVTQHNCAIQRVAGSFPQACFYELETYRRLLDAEVTRSCHILSGDHMCSYEIRQRGTTLN